MNKIPIKFKGTDIKTGKTVYGLYYLTPFDKQPAILEYALSGGYPACILVKPGSVRQLVGYDAEGIEIYEDEKVYCYSGFCLPPEDLRKKQPRCKSRVEMTASVVSCGYEDLNSPFDYQFLKHSKGTTNE